MVTRYGYAVPCERIEIVEASHPVPDAAGLAAAERMLSVVQGLTADDLVLCLISGGGSSLLPLPLPGLTLAHKQDVNRALLKSRRQHQRDELRAPAPVGHQGRAAGRGLPPGAGAHAADLRRAGRRPDRHRLGPDRAPTRPPAPTRWTSCAATASSCRPRCAQVLESGRGESIKPGDPRLARAEVRMIATPQMALEAAAAVARAAGYAAHILGDALEGEARDVGKVLAGIALQVAQRGQPFAAPCVLLSGGETTVTLRGDGRGGRNVECLLSLAITLGGQPRVHALAGDTDGVDGQEEIAGALLRPDTLARAWALGIKPQDALANNDGHGFFGALGDAVVTGPTLTNVNDFRAILIDARRLRWTIAADPQAAATPRSGSHDKAPRRPHQPALNVRRGSSRRRLQRHFHVHHTALAGLAQRQTRALEDLQHGRVFAQHLGFQTHRATLAGHVHHHLQQLPCQALPLVVLFDGEGDLGHLRTFRRGAEKTTDATDDQLLAVDLPRQHQHDRVHEVDRP